MTWPHGGPVTPIRPRGIENGTPGALSIARCRERRERSFIVTLTNAQHRRSLAAKRIESAIQSSLGARGARSSAQAAPASPSPFAALGLAVPLVSAVLDERYAQPTPVQAEVIPLVLAGGDVLACAQTGTGKTAALVLPILQRLATEGPARELEARIAESLSVCSRCLTLRHALVCGSISQRRQEIALRAGPDIVVATPGRLLDLMQQRLLGLDAKRSFSRRPWPPTSRASYVHRIGRTGRAGAKGRAISFCDREKQLLLRDVERLIRRCLPVSAS
jgi:superfamily II DNA/RNA helicase